MNSAIFLWGMPGSGKSTLGVKLSNKLSFTFVDLDKEIEKKENRSVAQIFETKGENYFREIESEVLKSLLLNQVVVSCGGGTPCFFNNAEWMNNNGITVYLTVNLKTLHHRLWNAKEKNRPMLLDKNEQQLTSFLEQLAAEREPFYTKAKIKFDPLRKEDLAPIIKDILT